MISKLEEIDQILEWYNDFRQRNTDTSGHMYFQS